MEVAGDDPLRQLKLRLLKSLGAGAGRPADLARLPDAAACLAAARALVLKTDEVDAWGIDDVSAVQACVGARNEAAALALLHAHADAIFGSFCSSGSGGASAAAKREQLAELSGSYCERVGAQAAVAAGEAGEEAAAGETAAAAAGGGLGLQAWAEKRGLATSLQPAVFSGGLRGLAAAGDLAAGSYAVELPAALLITYDTARESDLGRALVRIPGLGDDSIAVIWTMVSHVHLPASRPEASNCCRLTILTRADLA
jgi:hypothetical protein